MSQWSQEIYDSCLAPSLFGPPWSPGEGNIEIVLWQMGQPIGKVRDNSYGLLEMFVICLLVVKRDDVLRKHQRNIGTGVLQELAVHTGTAALQPLENKHYDCILNLQPFVMVGHYCHRLP